MAKDINRADDRKVFPHRFELYSDGEGWNYRRVQNDGTELYAGNGYPTFGAARSAALDAREVDGEERVENILVRRV